MKPRTLALLAGVVVALGAFIFFYERELPGTEQRRQLEKRAFRLEADDVVALEIERGEARVRLERGAPAAEPEPGAFPPPREWRVTAPFTARADRQLADQLATELAGLEVARELADAARAEVGLDPPRGRILWRTADRQGVLELGGEVPASSNLVASSSERPGLLVVPRGVAAHLDRAPGDWRDKQVVAASRDEVERIRLVPAGGEVVTEVVLTRQGESFRVERPFADAADPDVVDPLLSDLTALRAERFLDAPLPESAAAGMAAGPGRIELAVKGRTEPLVIELGAELEPEGARWLRVGGQAIEARTRVADALGRAPADWRSRRWASFDNWKIERIRIEDAAGKLELARDEGDWRRGEAKIGYSEVGDLLYAITSARATRVRTGAEATAAPPGRPELTVVFADAEGGEETLTLHGPAGDGDAVAARTSGREVVLELARADVDEIRAKIQSVRDAKPIVPAKDESIEPAPAVEEVEEEQDG